MLLNDISQLPDSKFNKVNRHLEENYGFKISREISNQDLVSIMEQINDEIQILKIKGDDSRTSPEISKRMLVLEGLKELREFAIIRLDAPKFNTVIDNLTCFVTDLFEITATPETAQRDFESAIKNAMDEYRSSRYRFPDDIVEQRVRQGAMARIQSGGQDLLDVTAGDEDMSKNKGGLEEDDPWGSVGKRAHALGGHASDIPDTPKAKHALGVLDAPELSLQPQEDPHKDMVQDKFGRWVPDPFKAQQSARKKGILHMKEENLVKNLRRLLETEVSQAEVMMAAKGFAQELQEMVEKIGRLQNEDLPPVTDQMRETYGMEAASAFQTQIYGALQGVMDSLYTAKGQVDDAVSNMAATGTFTADVDMDKDISLDTEPTGVGADIDVDADLDNLAGEFGAEDEFGGADEEEPLGREKKVESLQFKVQKMRTLVERAKKLKETKNRG